MIPLIEGLQKLNCSGCINLIELPKIDGLKDIDCTDCTKLTVIPQIDELKRLHCSGCTNLVKISKNADLCVLSCSRCCNLTHVPKNRDMRLFCYDCKWLDQKNVPTDMKNPLFKENIQKLIVLQKWFRNLLLSKHLTTMIKKIVPIYYHPDCKGGYLHKREMMSFIEDIVH